jgi:hypothetical protein
VKDWDGSQCGPFNLEDVQNWIKTEGIFWKIDDYNKSGEFNQWSNEEQHTDTDLSDIGILQSDSDHYIEQVLGILYHLDGISFDG